MKAHATEANDCPSGISHLDRRAPTRIRLGGVRVAPEHQNAVQLQVMLLYYTCAGCVGAIDLEHPPPHPRPRLQLCPRHLSTDVPKVAVEKVAPEADDQGAR